MFLRYGSEWLRQVAERLEELDCAAQEQLRDPATREALLSIDSRQGQAQEGEEVVRPLR